MKHLRLFGIATLLALMIPMQAAYAYKECALNVSQIFSGDDGNIWILFTNGGATVILSNDPDRAATLSMAMTALVASRPVSARYSSDSASCSATNMDLIGFWLN